MKLLILFLMAVSLNALAEKNMLGERTPANSEDPCAHEKGCGPCYKSCKSAVSAERSAEGVKTINTTSKKSSKKSTVVGE